MNTIIMSPDRSPQQVIPRVMWGFWRNIDSVPYEVVPES